MPMYDCDWSGRCADGSASHSLRMPQCHVAVNTNANRPKAPTPPRTSAWLQSAHAAGKARAARSTVECSRATSMADWHSARKATREVSQRDGRYR
eukprot:357005-Chlamydomonas_euryale.AAC.9